MITAKATTRIVDHGAQALLARVQALAGGTHVKVGVLTDEPKRERTGSSPMSLVEIAALHEFGAPGAHIPQRSFIRATVDEKRAEIVKLQHALATKLLHGQLDVTGAMDLLGAKVAGWIQKRIARGIAPPLAPETVARKGSSKPLVDTGQLRSAVSWALGKGR